MQLSAWSRQGASQARSRRRHQEQTNVRQGCTAQRHYHRTWHAGRRANRFGPLKAAHSQQQQQQHQQQQRRQTRQEEERGGDVKQQKQDSAAAVRTSNASTTRRSFALNVGVLLGSTALWTRKADSADALPFLSSRGARGILAEEEERLYNLRIAKEGEARQQLQLSRDELEGEIRNDLSQGNKLCATPFGVDIVGITELICLIGALVGGITARQRKNEMERLNEQLRKINMSLRQQARSGTVYAPGLSYAPTLPKAEFVGGDVGGTPPRQPASVTASAVTIMAPAMTIPDSTTLSMEEEEMNVDQLHCKEALKAGKRLLKENNGAAALVRFEKALMISKATGDKIQERRAYRGLAAAARIQGQYRSAIKHLEKVLEISLDIKEYTGDADAYGVIADCYTDVGEFERAAKFYDKYIERMNKDGPV